MRRKELCPPKGAEPATTTKQSIPMVSEDSAGGTTVARLGRWLTPATFTAEQVAFLERLARVEGALSTLRGAR